MTPREKNTLVAALRKQFRAQVASEPVNGGDRYRFAVTSPRFEGMPHLQRQDEIWHIVDETLSREAALDVSLILAYGPSELAAAG